MSAFEYRTVSPDGRLGRSVEQIWFARGTGWAVATQWLLDESLDMSAAFDEFLRGYLLGPQ